jgi:hypothetical protein
MKVEADIATDAQGVAETDAEGVAETVGEDGAAADAGIGTEVEMQTELAKGDGIDIEVVYWRAEKTQTEDLEHWMQL